MLCVITFNLSYFPLVYEFCHYLYFLPDRLEGKEKNRMLEVGKETEVGFEEDSEESMEEDKQYSSSLGGAGDSDDEPLVSFLSL